MKMTEQTKMIINRLAGILRLGDRTKQFVIISIATLATSLPVTVNSGPLALSNTPLFLENNVQPNIFFMLDDSGSMNWEVLMTESAVALHPGNPNSGNVDLTPDDETERLELCLGYNALAYNPDVTKYNGIDKVWKGKDSAGVDYAEMTTHSAVRNNPYSPTGTFDLTAAGIIAYFPWTDANSNGVYDVGECGANICTDNSDGVTFASLSAAEKQNFANWYSYYRKRDYVMKYAMGEVIYPSKHRMGLGTLWNRNSVGTPIKDVDNLSAPVNATAVANKTTLLDNVGKITPGSTTPLRRKLEDVGQYYDGTGNSALFGATYTHTDTFNSTSPILNAAKGGECQQNFTFLMTDGFWNGGDPSGTIGNADGDGNTAFDIAPPPAAPSPNPYEDAFSLTLADVAMHYYENDLASLADNVPTTSIDQNNMQHMVTYTIAFGLKGEISETYTGDDPNDVAFPGWPDPFSGNTDKRRIDDVWHAAFNSRGLYLNASDPNGLVTKFNEVLRSIDARAGSAAGVSVTSGTVSTTTRVYQTKFNSGDWSGELLAYKFDASNNIVAANDFAGANDAGPAIDAQVVPTSPGSPDNTNARVILSHNGTKGIPFRYDSTTALGADTISAAQLALLVDGHPAGNPMAEKRVSYLRGDHSSEQRKTTGGFTGIFRDRVKEADGSDYVLGDTVHSSPLYVGAPPFAYPDFLEGAGNEYYKYKLSYFNRTPIIYFGANDGMLHGVDATTGEEKIAYVPSVLYEKLPALTSPYYNHQYYVDESPGVGDTFYNGAWHTTLVGGLRGGGQGVFALDITDPSLFSESGTAPADTVLWEFTDADDPDLGYTYGRPAIVKMQNDRWYAVFSNGYNNTEADGAASTTGNAVLYIVDIETKAVTKIDTGAGIASSADGTTPNGLAKPAVVDVDSDYKVDYIYAGDLQGNMWKFDVTGSTPANWRNAGNRSILFTAVDSGGTPQPITTEPEIDLAPAGPKGLFIVFGTGKYLETSDITSNQEQTMYGIWDQAGYSGAATVNVTRADLVAQVLTNETDASSRELRLVTQNPIDIWGNGPGINEYMGWMIDLPESGERIITNPVLLDDKVIFISITPDDTPCQPGGTSWFMVFRLSNGGRTQADVIDVNEDGVVDTDDQGNSNTIVSGVRKQSLILNNDVSVMDDAVVASPGATVGQKCASAGSSKVITSDSAGNLGGTTLSRSQKSFRQGWRQLQ